MKKIIPFKKEIKFDDNLYEVTSISLEHSLHKEDMNVCGNFTISGEYRITENSTNTLEFSYDLPFTINIDEKYNIDKVDIDINDFYYEILDNKYLVINIEVKLDHIEEKEILLERDDSVDKLIDEINDGEKKECIEDEDSATISLPTDRDINNINVNVNDKIDDVNINIDNDIDDNKKDAKEEVKSLFANMTNEDTYVSYKVYIVRENDTIDSILNKYQIKKELIEQYNDLNELKIGDKVIIPYVKD